MVRIYTPFRSPGKALPGGRVYFVVTIARVWLVAVILAACQRAATPTAQPPVTAIPLPTPAVPAATSPSQVAGAPAGEIPGPQPSTTASPTGLARHLAAGTRFPTRTLTPTLTPNVFACLPPGEPDEVAQVQWVTDGDTIVVELQGRPKSVRYLGIDAPAYLPNSRFIGPLAFRQNRQLVEGQIVSLYRDGADSDETGQLLRYVVTHGVFVNLELVRLGLARATEATGTGTACAASLRAAEQTAQTSGVGLWSAQVVAAAITSQPTTPAVGAPVPTAAPSRPATTLLPGTPTLTLAPGQTASPTFTSAPGSAQTPTQVTPSATNQAATATLGADMGVHITDVQYNGTPSDQEKDEYVELTNEGSTPVTITGWRLVSKNTSATFTFPAFTLQVDVSCFVYTNQVDEDSCVNSSFGKASGIWGIDGDCAELYDTNSVKQSEFCY